MQKRNRYKLLFLGLGLLGMLFVSYFYSYIKHQELLGLKERFSQQTESFIYSTEERYLRNVTLLEGCNGLLLSSEKVTKNEWNRFISVIDLSTNFPAIDWIGLVRNINPKQKSQFTQQMIQGGESNYNIWPQEDLSECFPMMYVTPDRYEDLIGYDFAQSPKIREMFIKASAEGLVQSSPALHIRPTSSNLSELMLLLPVIDKSKPQSTPFGWVVTQLDFKVIIEQVAQGLNLQDINIRIYRENKTTPQDMIVEVGSKLDLKPLFSSSKQLKIADETWLLQFSTGFGYRSQISGVKPALFFLILAVINIAVCYLLYRKMTVEAPMPILATEGADAAMQLEAVINSMQYSLIMTDLEGNILVFNRAAELMLGYKAGEVVGKLTPEAFHEHEEMTQRAEQLSIFLRRKVESAFEVFVAQAKKGIPDEREWTYVRKDKSRLKVFLSITTVKNRMGQHIGYLGVGRDTATKIVGDSEPMS